MEVFQVTTPNFYKQIDSRWTNHVCPGYAGSLGWYGCGPTAACNALSALPYLNQQKLTPVDTFDWMCRQGLRRSGHGSTTKAVLTCLHHYGLTSAYTVTSRQLAKAALQAGGWLITCVNSKSRWTRNSHHILVYKLVGEHVWVSDSASNEEYRHKGGTWSELVSSSNKWTIIPNPALLGATTTTAGDVQTIQQTYGVPVSVDYTQLKPYIITLHRNSPEVNWKELKNNKVVGAIIEAGQLYNSLHMKQSTFRNPQAYDQVKSAIDANSYFGYYMPARARTAVEVEEEMYELSFLVRKYPPALGVWLQLSLPGTISQNDNLLKAYYKELVRLGLKNKIGIQVSRNDLKKFSWDKFQTDWYLWLDEKVSNVTQLDALLTPEFFDTDGKSG